MEVKLGSFNFGIPQEQLRGQDWTKKGLAKFKNLVFYEVLYKQNLDVLCGCEVGSHRLGLLRGIPGGDKLLSERALILQNYFTEFRDAHMLFQLLREPYATALAPGSKSDPQLVLTAVRAEADDKTAVPLIIGNLHIRTRTE